MKDLLKDQQWSFERDSELTPPEYRPNALTTKNENFLNNCISFRNNYPYNYPKCNIIAKSEHMKQAQSLFNKEDVEIVDRHVSSGRSKDQTLRDKFRSHKQSEYNQIVEKLSKHAKVSPQNVFHCFSKGLQNKVTFLSRTTPNFIGNLEETERKIKENLIPAITGKSNITDEERSLFSLPVRDGELNIVHPEDSVELNFSRQMAACLDNDDDPEAQQSLIVKQIRKKSPQELKKRYQF